MIGGEAGASAEDSSYRACKVPRSLGSVLGGTGEPWEGCEHGEETLGSHVAELPLGGVWKRHRRRARVEIIQGKVTKSN